MKLINWFINLFKEKKEEEVIDGYESLRQESIEIKKNIKALDSKNLKYCSGYFTYDSMDEYLKSKGL